MKQTGILKIKGTNENGLVIEPITLSSIYFSQDGVLKLTTKTDEAGRFDFDLPLGKYRVEVNAGTGALLPLSLGNLFELKSGDAIDTFEKWAEIPTTDNDLNDLILKQFKELADSAAKSATDAQLSANSAHDTVTQVVEDKGKELDQKEAGAIENISQLETGAVENITMLESDALANLQTMIESGQVLISQQVVDGNNAIVITINNGKDELNQIAQNAKSSEENAKASEEEAKRQVDSIQAKLDEKWDIQQTVGNGNILRDQAYGLGSRTTTFSTPVNSRGNGCFFFLNAALNDIGGVRPNSSILSRSLGFRINESDYRAGMFFEPHSGNISFWAGNTNDILNARRIYSENNTIVDANGFLKKASPVIRIFRDHIEHNDQFETNPILEKPSVGVYKISGTLGLAEGVTSGDWYIELPKDRYGEPYFNVEYDRTEDGVILRVYERIELYVPSERKILDREGNPVEVKEKLVLNGELIDLKPEWRCIDLRFKEEIKEIEPEE